jgi:hypothetical protein
MYNHQLCHPRGLYRGNGSIKTVFPLRIAAGMTELEVRKSADYFETTAWEQIKKLIQFIKEGFYGNSFLLWKAICTISRLPTLDHFP